jgi:hypothetical protein
MAAMKLCQSMSRDQRNRCGIACATVGGQFGTTWAVSAADTATLEAAAEVVVAEADL